MKKFVCLLMVAMLALSLSVAVFARYEGCPDCETKLEYKTRLTNKAVKCDVVAGKWDLWWYEYEDEYCPDCGVVQSSRLISKWFECGHKAG